jgi:hypothetical protein
MPAARLDIVCWGYQNGTQASKGDEESDEREQKVRASIRTFVLVKHVHVY